MTNTPPRDGPRPWIVIALLLAATAGGTVLEGRIWWCECRQVRPWITDVWTSHCSQHLADPYSLTHVSHGLILYGLLTLVARRLSVAWRLCIAVAVAGGWEVLENSQFIIDRYRESTMSLEYMGDSIVNALGDVLSCVLGFYLARLLGLWKSVALFLTVEVALLFVMRDNLTLNVVMLLWPIEAIKQWQTAGHVVPPA